tara:strand:- start:18300 stop:18929 length:630 start_codon:yes stop_codon:yes gene_type:complete
MISSSNNIHIDNSTSSNTNSTIFSILLNYEPADSDDEDYIPDINPFNSQFMRDSQEFIIDTIGSELERIDENMQDEDVLRRVSSTINYRIQDRFQNYFDRFLDSIRFQIEYRTTLGNTPGESGNSNSCKEHYDNVVDKFNGTQKFLKNTNQVENEPVCAVCLENLKLYRVWHKPKSCNHIFHPKCLQKHYQYCKKSVVDCPVCRKDMAV